MELGKPQTRVFLCPDSRITDELPARISKLVKWSAIKPRFVGLGIIRDTDVRGWLLAGQLLTRSFGFRWYHVDRCQLNMGSNPAAAGDDAPCLGRV